MSITIQDFIGVPLFFCDTVGLTPYRIITNGHMEPIPKWKTALFATGFLHEMVYIPFQLLAFQVAENLSDGVEIILYTIFMLLALAKLGTLMISRPLFTWLIGELHDMFPKTPKDHIECRSDVHLERLRKIMKIYVLFQMTMIITFNGNTFFVAVYNYFTKGFWYIGLPYNAWFPFRSTGRGRFEFLFFTQVVASYFPTGAILAGDLLLFAVGIQLIMHYERLSFQLRNLKARGGQWSKEDAAKLRQCVITHNRLIKYVKKLFY